MACYSDSLYQKITFYKVMRGTAKDNNVPLVDLNEDSVNYLMNWEYKAQQL